MRTAPSTCVVFASLPLFMLVETAEAAQCCLDPLGYYLSSGRCTGRPGTGSGWPADPAKCTRPYCFDSIAKVGWRPADPTDFSCDRYPSSWVIQKEQYDALAGQGKVR
jgi:hypothetical protein